MLEGYFRLKEHGTTVGTEVLAGLTTFMVMAYIIFVNPAILSFAGMPALQPQGVPFAPDPGRHLPGRGAGHGRDGARHELPPGRRLRAWG